MTKQDDEDNLEVSETDVKNTQEEKQKFNPFMAYTAIVIMLFLNMSKNWQQSALSYFYGFQGVGDKFQNPSYELSAAFPQLNLYYGFLNGMVYDVPYSICGLLASGVCSSRFRVAILGIVAIFMSST